MLHPPAPFPLPPCYPHLENLPWIIQGGKHAEGPIRDGLACLYSRPSSGLIHLFSQQHSLPPSRGPDGRFRPLQQVLPMEDSFIGGWNVSAPNSPVSLSPPPTPPPKDAGVRPSSSLPPPNVSSHLLQTGYPFVNVHRVVSSPVTTSMRDPHAAHGPSPLSSSSFNDHQLSRLTAAERSKNLRKRRMNPYLQFMCGPLLRYDTMDEHGVWHGAALIVGELL